jgi:hypothetical protein
MLKFLNQFQHKQEMRESKDEILVGKMVAAMARLGYPAIGFHAHSDYQAVTFRAKDDEILHTVVIILDRKTGGGAISEAVLGSKATLRFQAEVKNRMADPDDLLHMYRTDLQNIFKIPMLGDVRLDHQLNSVLATRQCIIEIGKYILEKDKDGEQLSTLLQETIAELREKLKDYKKT